jgi:hypothetical protein
MDKLTPPSFIVRAQGTDGPADVISALLLASFLAGDQPWVRMVQLDRVRPEATLLPPGEVWQRVVVGVRGRRAVATGDGWTLGVVRYGDRTAYLTVTAAREELAERVLAEATAGAEEPEPAEREALVMDFWHLTTCGPTRRRRSVATPQWADIRRNYASSVAEAVDRLMTLDPAGLSGRILLLHGPPGTGKTTALRALADGWREWCGVECVLDPEQLLRDSGYLLEVAMGEDDGDGPGTPAWRLVILEDCDELIRSGAKEGAGQKLSRLLNLTDGLLGHGLKVLVAITTNEPLLNLHPAVVRPGRCLAQVEVGRLPRAEAAAWLGTGAGVPPEGATLAELYAMKGELEQVDRREPAKVVGLYL